MQQEENVGQETDEQTQEEKKREFMKIVFIISVGQILLIAIMGRS